MEKGYLAIILHAQLPFVRHPEVASFLEEDWLFEAITESYIPLISVLNRILKNNVPCRLTLSISPPLAEMLNEALLQSRYLHYLCQRIELSEKEVQRTKNSPHLSPLAEMYLEHFISASKLFQDSYQGNLISAFKDLQDQRVLGQDFNSEWLQPIEEQDNILRELDYRSFRSDAGPGLQGDAVADNVRVNS